MGGSKGQTSRKQFLKLSNSSKKANERLEKTILRALRIFFFSCLIHFLKELSIPFFFSRFTDLPAPLVFTALPRNALENLEHLFGQFDFLCHLAFAESTRYRSKIQHRSSIELNGPKNGTHKYLEDSFKSMHFFLRLMAQYGRSQSEKK